jgi:TolA-binding protein
MNHDLDIREDALFNHAKLAFELSYNPFDDAITAFERYIEEFPNSKRSDEAYGFLLEVYLTSKDYDRALKALDRIQDKNIEVRKAWQLVSYNRGVELFRADKFEDAEHHFNEVRTYPIDPVLTAESHFWQGELNYLLKRYPTATSHYGAFIEQPGAYNSPFYAQAEYARGYTLFKRKKYVDALSAFRSFLKVDDGKSPRRTLDAQLRAGDCFFANKSFAQAADSYAAVLASEASDYAQFQVALCRGYLDDRAAAIDAFDLLVRDYPISSLVPEARYEAARLLIQEGKLDLARVHLDALLSQHPNSPKTKYALVDLCLIGLKQGREQDVLNLWDRIRAEYGNDAIAGDAYNVVEPLLIDRGLLDDIPSGVGLDGDEIEERLFTAARAEALERNCDKAVMRLGDYIRSYDQGKYLTEAHFFLGNCAYDLGRNAEAREAFEYVLVQPTNDYTEPSALGAATMAWNASDLSTARKHYATLEAVSVRTENVLEARIGLMRCHYLLKEPESAKAYADQVLADEKTPEDIRRTALFWRGKIAFDNERWVSSNQDLSEVAGYGGARGAESKYLMCEIAFKQNQYEAAEQEIFELIDAFTAYDKWKIKSFVLLVKVYMGIGDLFQARATAESILANVDQPEIVGETEDLLQRIQQLESENLTPSDTTQFVAPIPEDTLNLNPARP